MHDIAVTVGVYSLFGLEVTPPTVIAVLTILGYSIYDGIVVFDKVEENTKPMAVAGKMTYMDMVNTSLNQVLMRTLNTSLTALLPILSLLVIGSFVLGATTLQEFAIALLVGLDRRRVLVDLHCVAVAGHSQGARAALSRRARAPR